MTKDAQRIAIATACGWTMIEALEDGFEDRRWQFFTNDQNGYPDESYKEGDMVGREKPEHMRLSKLPDYTTCLNACAEMEKTLTEEERYEYASYIDDVHPDWIVGEDSKPNWDVVFVLIHATAPQRCTAFLKAKGLWRESSPSAGGSNE